MAQSLDKKSLDKKSLAKKSLAEKILAKNLDVQAREPLGARSSQT
jgi:hypothetical protein